ncbi:hypothetical protein EJ357_03560 [Streptomyces cyaneochromogenes]|uniref:Uncharacterized protein n=1 Tax=Streptomyces cyaneochromogenes TaxID=2496836 RepID=A0A3S9M0A4_9ACTN|nr:hypothetical protein [Streptomyces cyaneochromogenes]AZQ32633.1 hypothetical protein EJ357_03560 [Streptomyces cyaneochromogenes]
MPQLTTQNAVITTATIEVKTLTLGGKQVTQSVFRQLREEPLINHDGTLNGTPWGFVNYHPDKCADGEPHRHVVWQRDGELLRATVSQPYDCRGAYWSAAGQEFLEAHAREVVAGRGRYFGGKLPELVREDDAVVVRHRVDGFPFSVILDAPEDIRVRDAWRAYLSWRTAVEEEEKPVHNPYPVSPGVSEEQRAQVVQKWTADRAERTRKARERLDEVVEALGPVPSPEEVDALYQEHLDEAKDEAARRQRVADALTAVKALPQLFIAV